MQRKSWRLPAVVVAIAAFISLTFTSSPSVSSIPPIAPQVGLASRAPSAHPSGAVAQSDFIATLPYGRSIARAAALHRLDGLLIAAIIEVESGFAANVVSPRGAVGLMQIKPQTAMQYGVTDLADPERNLAAGSRYLAEMIDRFDGDLEAALAAYNAGPGVVERYRGVPPFRETRAHVKRVMDIYLEHHRRLWHGDATDGAPGGVRSSTLESPV